ncbi:MAG: tol-pal system protein YbgF [Burkholderiales bacterium]|nr:tol-pal system protein YbgF [Burkholderiales bacterium]
MQTPAHALFGDNEARNAILQLRQQLKTMQETQTQMFDRLQYLTKEVQTLRGQVDDLTNNYGRQQDQLTDTQGKKQEAAAKVNKATQVAQDKEILAQQALDESRRYIEKQDYANAIKGLTKFTQTYSTSKLYPEALYWLGTSYYGTKQFGRAIEVENRMISSYPKHAKVPDALLILGLAQEDSGKKTDANATFARLKKQYPKSEAAKLAQ